LVAAAAGAAITAAGLAAVLARKPLPLEPRRVLVLAFQNRTGDSTLDAVGDVAADYLIRGLRATQMVEEVLDARSQGEASAARRLNATSARAAARAAGAGNIVLGAYDRAPGDSVQFQAEVLDTRTGRAVRLIGPLSAPVGARLVALEGLRTRVMAAVGSLLEPDFSEATSLPATYEALVEWKAGIDGWDACGGPGCRGQVLEHFRRAATIDSNFTLPLTEAAFKSWQVGDCARVDSIAAALRPRLVRLPPVDGTQLEVAASLCHGDLPAALDAATGGVDGAPADERLLSWKAMVLLFSNRPRETIDILERFDETRALEPGQDVALLLDAYHRVGMYDRALAYIAQVGRVKLNTSADPRDLLLEQKVACLAALGRLDDAAKTMEDEVRQFGAYQQGVRVIGMLEGAGQELAAHGHALAAKQAFDRAIAWAQAQPADQQATSDSRRALASVLNSAGRWDEALALYRAVAAVDSSDTEVQAALGDLAARRGDRADAERIDRWLAAQGHLRREGAWSESWALYHRGRLAGLLGERERAIGLLRQAAQIGFSGWWVAHVDPDLAPLRADPAFQEWIRPKD
jgi:tetratricopeptide (TPR) repeat protein